METEEAEKLRNKWGNKPCDHPHVEKEYYLGSDTGDYVCTTCGKEGDGKHWNEKQDN